MAITHDRYFLVDNVAGWILQNLTAVKVLFRGKVTTPSLSLETLAKDARLEQEAATLKPLAMKSIQKELEWIA